MTGAHDGAIAALRAWTAPDAEQDAVRRAHLAHLDAHPDALERTGPTAHLTASALVLDESGRNTLLVLHRRGRFWVQPGGHVETGDASLTAAALREAGEETALATGSGGLHVQLDGAPVDLHRHRLDAAFGRCTEHLDVAFLLTAPLTAAPRASAESVDAAWWPLTRLPAGVVDDLPPRLGRARAVLLARRDRIRRAATALP